MITYKQLTLAEVYEDCQNKFGVVTNSLGIVRDITFGILLLRISHITVRDPETVYRSHSAPDTAGASALSSS